MLNIDLPPSLINSRCLWDRQIDYSKFVPQGLNHSILSHNWSTLSGYIGQIWWKFVVQWLSLVKLAHKLKFNYNLELLNPLSYRQTFGNKPENTAKKVKKKSLNLFFCKVRNLMPETMNIVAVNPLLHRLKNNCSTKAATITIINNYLENSELRLLCSNNQFKIICFNIIEHYEYCSHCLQCLLRTNFRILLFYLIYFSVMTELMRIHHNLDDSYPLHPPLASVTALVKTRHYIIPWIVGTLNFK